jgi:dTDP-4-dehydrorhamnose 3,5-epimerase
MGKEAVIDYHRTTGISWRYHVQQTMEEITKPLSPIQPSSVIEGVFTVAIKVYEDERGRFMETFRRSWFPWVNWDRMQGNRSDSKPGVLRGLHYHHHQIDYWYVPTGIVRAGLVDLRPSSPTYLSAETLEIGDSNNIGVFIPVGVAHGFLALTHATLMYIVNNYYEGGHDELGVAWNDPAFKLAWGIDAPLLSPRDCQNRLLSDIPPHELPR